MILASVVMLGFLPWVDPQRGIAVAENPAAVAAQRAARLLIERGCDARSVHAFGVAVTGEGIDAALAKVRSLAPRVVVALGQTRGAPRVERAGRVPGSWTGRPLGVYPLVDDVADIDALVAELNTLVDPSAETGPFAPSDDAGGYFCDHLCVELAVDASARRSLATFLHVPATDGLGERMRDARIAQYAEQAARAAEVLLGRI